MTGTIRSLLIATALALAPLPAPAAPGGGITLEQAAAQAVRQTGGRVLSAQAEKGPEGLRYRIKLLKPDGRVVVIYINARH